MTSSGEVETRGGSRLRPLVLGGVAVVLASALLVSAGRRSLGAPTRVSPDALPTSHAAGPASPKAVDARPAPERAAAPKAAPSAAGDVAVDDDDPLADVRSARDDASPSGAKALVAALESPDPVVVSEAARTLVERNATAAIEPLARIDLGAAGLGALSIVDALGKLGGMATGGEKDRAVGRLLDLLSAEKAHPGPDGAAHLLQIYEALGETGDPRARGPLEAELADPSVGRAPKVVIVKALVSLGASGSRDAFTAERARQAAASAEDGLEEELRVELLAALDAALR